MDFSNENGKTVPVSNASFSSAANKLISYD